MLLAFSCRRLTRHPPLTWLLHRHRPPTQAVESMHAAAPLPSALDPVHVKAAMEFTAKHFCTLGAKGWGHMDAQVCGMA